MELDHYSCCTVLHLECVRIMSHVMKVVLCGFLLGVQCYDDIPRSLSGETLKRAVVPLCLHGVHLKNI